MKALRRLPVLAAVAACSLAVACAKQAPPPGGPEDRIPPSVVSTMPTSGTAGIAVDSAILIRFSEPMRHEDVEGAVFVFPAPDAPPQLDWEGEVLRIVPDTAWSADQTYVVTLQAEARDLRGNRLQRSLQVAFSTGEQIDSGRIVGRVYQGNTPAAGVLALCYRLSRSDLNPEVDTADYVVQTDSSGAFEFFFLSPGQYRVFGLDDRDRDWLWNTGVENIAVPSSDCAIPSREDATLAPLFLTALDTVRPALASCRTLSGRMVRVELDRPADSGWLAAVTVSVRTDSGEDSAWAVYVRDSLSDCFFAQFGDSAITGPGIVTVVWPSPLATADTCSIAPPIPDEPPPAFGLWRIQPDTVGGMVVQPESLRLEFDAPLLYLQGDRIMATSSAGALVPRIGGPFTISLAAGDGGVLRDSVRLVFLRGAVVGEGGFGWPAEDSVAVAIGLPVNDSVGSFEVVFDRLSDPVTDRLGLAIRRMDRQGNPEWRDVHSTTVTGELLQGAYALYLLSDRNGDRRFAPGWPYPYRPADALWPLADTLHVRARFTAELHLDWQSKN